MSDLTIKDTDPNPSASVQFNDADGNPTTPDDVPVWASSDTSIANVTASADGLSASIVQTGTLGACVISVTSTRSSDGVVVGGQATLTVVASEESMASVTLTAGAAAAPPVAAAAPAEAAAPAADASAAPAADASAPAADANTTTTTAPEPPAA